MSSDVTAIIFNAGSIVFSGIGVYFLTQRGNRQNRLEDDRRAADRSFRRRLVDLEDFQRRAEGYLERLGDIPGIPPWKGRS